jgi:glycosyltransferase involved in cell wall biosynthesis
MRILFKQFLSQNHSWSFVGQNLAQAFINNNHNVDLISTNGYEYFPKELYKYVKPTPDKDYDCQISYTAMKNFQHYLQYGNKNRFGIWAYEFAGKNALPTGFAKHHKFVDKMLVPSKFSKQIFIDSGVPEDKLVVVPHGIDLNRFKNTNKYPLKTNKKYKILLNIAQLHIRKNLAGTLEAYGKAFTKKDDVALIVKVVDKKPEQVFEVSFKEIYNKFIAAYPNHGEIEVITQYIDNIEELYNACDIMFSLTHAECFFFPALEALAAKKVVIVPNYGGQLEFLNDKNAILIDGKTCNAPPQALYWEVKAGTTYFEADTNIAADKLRDIVNNYDFNKSKLLTNVDDLLSEYSWNNIIKQIEKICI